MTVCLQVDRPTRVLLDSSPHAVPWDESQSGPLFLDVALVFTDIVNSTTMVYELGDDAYDGILTVHMHRIKELLTSFRGWGINTTGDGVLCAFFRASDAVAFARDLALAPGSDFIQIRAGIHFGQVKLRQHDVCGKEVHFASRVMSQAGGAEVWLSDDAKVRLDMEDRRFSRQLRFHFCAECALKNVPGTHHLWRLG